jgi:hypothetical protein
MPRDERFLVRLQPQFSFSHTREISVIAAQIDGKIPHPVVRILTKHQVKH